MTYKFEQLEVWQLALEYIDMMYALAESLPSLEEYNLKSQLRRAATSIALNIAEGSTSQSDAEQARFLGLALRSLVETVACQHLIHRRGYLSSLLPLRNADRSSQKLFAKLQAFRSRLIPVTVREEPEQYLIEDVIPFSYFATVSGRPSAV